MLGEVKEVHAWTNRPVWPQGVEVGRPEDPPPAPATLDWNEWIGPAPTRPFHPTYHPGRWRAWWDFGTGSLGDMGCHILDPVFGALDLKYPASVEGCISTYYEDFWKLVEPKNETYPRSTIVRYNFPARGNLAPVQLTWWDGGLMPARPAELEVGRKLGDEDGGVLLIGSEATLMAGCYGRSPRLIPEARMQAFTPPPKTLERIPKGEDGHEQDWIRACKGGKPACVELRHLRPALRDGADGQPGGALPEPAAAVGRRGDEGDQRRRRRCLRAAPVPRGLEAVDTRTDLALQGG